MTRILLVGGGGREHALAWRMQRDDDTIELIAAPGNPGIASLARCVDVAADNIADLVRLARHQEVDAVVVGPEGPLAAGLADRLIAERIPVFGPTAAAAQLETSKRFAKDVMHGAMVPTARASTHTDAHSAKQAVHAMADGASRVVIKASGLAAGKGVIVAESVGDAERAIDDMLQGKQFGDAGSEVLVEEFMEGEELSLFVISDGRDAMPLVPAQDHKRLLAGDEGPNTGGMGAYAPVSIATHALVQNAMDTVIRPTLTAMADRKMPFRGLLYAGLMLTRDGPKVVEFNCRFGDPETQAVLPVLRGSLLRTLLEVARGESIRNLEPIGWNDTFAVTTVVAAQGYPGTPKRGDAITLPERRDNVFVFHAGTATDTTGRLVTAGGRVLACTAVAPTFEGAQSASRSAADEVRFDGKHFRDDIGWREYGRDTRRA